MSRRRQLLRGGRKGAQLIANVSDVAYKAPNGKIMVVAQDLWDASLGTPVGVVVIPSGFAPDGKARIVSLYWGSLSSTSATSAVKTYWSRISSDISLPNYDRVPITNNKGLTNTGTGTSGFLPSDRHLSGTASYVDPVAMYDSVADNSELVPSPYLGDTPNPAYYAPISGKNNALSDFSGKGNTDVLVTGTVFDAAEAARNYKSAGAEEVEWYLPAMGELGYLVVRFKKIAEVLTMLGAADFEYTYYWSSTEESELSAYYLDLASDYVDMDYSKGNPMVVRPFAMLDF